MLARTISQDKEIKGIKLNRSEIVIILDDIILYRENCKDSTKTLLYLINISKVAEYKINKEICCISVH